MAALNFMYGFVWTLYECRFFFNGETISSGDGTAHKGPTENRLNIFLITIHSMSFKVHV